MTDKEFDMQIWRRYDIVTLDTGLTAAISNVCFLTRSVRIYVKDIPQEWCRCERIVSHQSKLGGATDDDGIIEELHKKVLMLESMLEKNKKKVSELEEKLAKDKVGELLNSVNILRGQLNEKKSRVNSIDACIERMQKIFERLDTDE